MIKLTKAKSYDYCDFCNSKEDIKEITSQNGNSICLCKNCMRKVKDIIEDEIDTFTYDDAKYKAIDDRRSGCAICAFRDEDCIGLRRKKIIPECNGKIFIEVY